MKFELLSHVVDELAAFLPGGRLERVYQGADGGLYFSFHRDRKNYFLLLSPDRSLPRLHLVTAKPVSVPITHSLTLYLRSHLTGARLAGLGLLNRDRVAEFLFEKAGTGYRLVFELIGTFPNIILTDSSATILAVYYPRPFSSDTARPMLPGIQYVPPSKKASPSVDHSGQDATIRQDESVGSPSKEAELYYQQVIEQREFTSLRTMLVSLIRRTLLKTERRLAALSNDLTSADRAEEYKKAGMVILANIDRLKPGMELAQLPDYEGKIEAIPLDPRLSPSRNADRYFKKYKKAKAGLAIIQQRLHSAEEETAFLKTLHRDIDKAHTRSDLASIRSMLAAEGYIKENNKEKKYSEPLTPGFRTFTFHGWEIFVGKGALGNDYITTKLACADDLWLHAEGMPGSHVLVKNPNNAEIPAEVLVKAAALAAYYSKGKLAGKVSVAYTRARFVKKPKGAKPGLVMLRERKSIMVKPESG